jgi:hypothetical protein
VQIPCRVGRLVNSNLATAGNHQHGPEVALRELGRRCKDLADYHAAAWAALKKAEWRRLVKGWPAADKGKLRDLLADTDAAVQKVAEACVEVRRSLAGLLQGVGQ